ncbi:MAG: 16S rRNA (uracil(1498)-N(3))-methyltransferase [Clostridia bacterium]|nr:16S rRNA (uracil(1498)-N(3))-methyltransferase [Clostridia bacterium]
MSRFFVNSEDIHSDYIDIRGEDINHIKKVLRLRCGDTIIVSDGNATDYTARIEKVETDYVRTAIIESIANTSEPPIEVTLLQGLPKSDKMDLIIQKSIELGVNKIIPVITERTVVKIDNKKDVANKVSRWQRISLEAAKQCNRGIVPTVEYPVTFAEALKIAEAADISIIPYEKEKTGSLKRCLDRKEIKKIMVLIGPEGGFSENEVEKAISLGIKPVTLGPRILRTETAGIAVLSILMYELGDVNR